MIEPSRLSGKVAHEELEPLSPLTPSLSRRISGGTVQKLQEVWEAIDEAGLVGMELDLATMKSALKSLPNVGYSNIRQLLDLGEALGFWEIIEEKEPSMSYMRFLER